MLNGENMKKKVILVIEDDVMMQNLVRLILKNTDVIFYQAYTVPQAHELFTEHKNEITHIYVDGCVPGNSLNTLDLVREIRPEFKGKIFAMSSRPDFNEILVEAGCDRDIQKRDLKDIPDH